MRVIVYPHSMELGGSQMNAIDIAGAVRDLGHEVTVYAEPGVLVERVRALGLPFVEAAPSRVRPSPGIARHLSRLSRDVGADVLHGYEWPPALECYAAAAGHRDRAAVVTVMSMAVAPFLPAGMPLVVGTAHLQDGQRGRRGPVDLIEPPVDTVTDAPGTGGGEFRARLGVTADVPLLVVVSRLARELKLEGILTAIRATGRLAAAHPLLLVVVGDGPARDEVADAAAKANAEAGHDVVRLLGSLPDPRGAYDAADVVLGMGGSALRALAFAKPLVVQGERGFFELLTPESEPTFLRQGWYGVGGDADPVAAEDRFIGLVRPLLDDADRRRELGRAGRSLVESRFSLERAAHLQVEIYRDACRQRDGLARTAVDGLVAAGGVVAHKVARRVQRARGASRVDDFNARPA
ncbi:hypothetical protein ASE38_01470 [Cellulomonas sp. Root930]|nr:hypothetical protein ASE38_01470 [Cellulomonas sp. Root930]